MPIVNAAYGPALEHALQVVEPVARRVVVARGQRSERQQVHQAVRHQVEHDRLEAAGAVAQERVEQVPGVRDRRIRDHAAEARLPHRREIAPDDRDQRQEREQVVDRRRHHFRAEQAQRGQQHAGLDDRRHVRGDRNARAFVGVRRPGVERHDGALQEERQQDQCHAGGGHRVGGPQARREDRDRQRAAAAVEQRDAHQEHRRRRAAQDQVLERRFRAFGPLECKQHQHIDRQCHDFEPEEKRQEAVRREQQAKAVQRRQHQDVELSVLAEIVARQQQHGQRQRQHDRLGERPGRIDRKVAGERRRRIAADIEKGRRHRGRRHGDARQRQRRPGTARVDLDADQHDDARQKQVFRRQRNQYGKPAHRALPGIATLITRCWNSFAASSDFLSGSSG